MSEDGTYVDIGASIEPGSDDQDTNQGESGNNNND